MSHHTTFKEAYDRLSHISALTDGWYNGTGTQPIGSAVKQAHTFLTICDSIEIEPLPLFAPLTDGTIHAEISTETVTVTAHIGGDPHQVDVTAQYDTHSHAETASSTIEAARFFATHLNNKTSSTL